VFLLSSLSLFSFLLLFLFLARSFRAGRERDEHDELDDAFAKKKKAKRTLAASMSPILSFFVGRLDD
jgi:hypothetical protein